ncbi:MAG: PAS domain-containing protein, partial [Anaerolineales bacterium]|nr:PAS domain-containing protein [Anaerolineales bacterium]
MQIERPVAPATYLVFFALMSAGIGAAIYHWYAAAFGAVFLFGGVILAAAWYSRWVYILAVALANVIMLPATLDSGLLPPMLWGFHIGGSLITALLAEIVSRLMASHERTVARGQQAQERLREILERNPAVVYGLVPDGIQPGCYRITFVSDNARERLGLAPDTVTRSANTVGLAGTVTGDALEAWHRALLNQGEATIEYRLTPTHGNRLWVRDVARAVRDSAGRVVEVVGYLIDISREQHYADALADLVRNSPAVLFRAVPDPEREHGWHFTFNSENVVDVIGYTVDELRREPTLWVARTHPDDLARTTAATRQASLEAGNGRPVVVEYRFYHRDGHIIWLQDTLRIVLDDAGQPCELIGQNLDVTARREAEIALAENRRQQDEVVRHSPALLYRGVPDETDPENWRIVYNSSNAPAVIGYSVDELDSDQGLWLRSVHPDDQARMAEAWKRSNVVAATRNGPVTIEYRFIRKDGTLIWVQDTLRVLCDDRGRPIEMYGQTLDVTERKTIEAALAEDRRIQDESVRNSPAVLFRARPATGTIEGWEFLFHSANTLDVLGYTAEEIQSDPTLWMNAIHPDDLAGTFMTPQMLSDLPATATMPIVYDYRFRHKAGHYIWIQNSLRIMFDADGRPIELFGQSVDVTARKQIEQALEASRRQLDDVIRNNPAALFHAVPDPATPDGLRYIYNSANIAQVIGIPLADLENSPGRIIERIHPDDRERTLAATRAFATSIAADDAPVVQVYRFRHGDGREIWLQDTLRPIRDAQGRVREVIGQNLDVTAQKQMERALAEANERVRQVLAYSPILSYSCAPLAQAANPWQYTFISDRSREILGLEPEALITGAADWLERVHPADREVVAQMLTDLGERSEYSFEFRFQRPGGALVWLHDFGRVIRDADGRVTTRVGHLVDNTAQREAAEALRQAEARLHHIVHNSPMATYTLQVALHPTFAVKCTFITESIIALTGFSAREIIDDHALWSSHVHPEDRARLWSRQARTASPRTTAVIYRFQHRDGHTIWLEDTTHAVLGPNGELVEIIGQVQDVTTRQQAQLQLEESQRFISQMAAAIPSQVLVADVAGRRILYANRQRADLIDYERAAAQGMTVDVALRARIHPDDLALFNRETARVATLPDDETLDVSLRVQNEGGEWRDLFLRYRVFDRDPDGVPSRLLIVWDDVTETRRAERALNENQRLLSRLTAALPSVAFVLNVLPGDDQGAVLYENRSWLELLGFTRDHPEYDGSLRFVIDRIHPEDRAAWLENSERLSTLADGDVIEQEYRARAVDGAWRWLRSRMLVFHRTEAGEVSQAIGVVDDMTSTRRAQEALAASQRLLNRVAQTVPNVLYVLDFTRPEANGGLAYANRSLPALLGYPTDQATETGWLRFLLNCLHPEDRDVYQTMIRRLFELADGEILETEYRLRDAAGAWHWMRLRDLVFERGPSGTVTQVIGLMEDVTASKALQNDVRAERDFAQLVLSTLGQGVVVVDQDGLCEYINPAGARILGVDAQAFVGADLARLAAAPRQDILAAWDDLSPEMTRPPSTLELRHVRPDGAAVDLLVTATARIRDSQSIGAVVVFSDVTERKAMERTLSRTNEELAEALERARDLTREAQSASRAKSDFLANMSHEIRTPMNAIVGLAEHLLDGPLHDDQRNAVKLMSDSGQALLEIINDILDFSKIEAGRLELDLHEFSPAAVVESVVDLLAIRARQKGLRIACLVDPALPEALVGDSGRLRQVLVNLLSNAVKFTSEGQVSVRASIEPEGERAWLHLVIRDEGIGIAPDALERLFKPFEQAESGTTRRFGGTGLGLAIVKRLLDLMSGEIQLDSAPGAGTTVTLRVPCGWAAVPAPIGVSELRGRLLVVEADALSREIATRYGSAAGFACEAVRDPAEALTRLRLNDRYEALVVGFWEDWRAPARLVEAVRDDPVLKRIRCIAIADDLPEHLRVDRQVRRPIRRALFTDALIGSAPGAPGSKQDGPKADPAGRAPQLPRGQVLLAEDNPVNQKVASLQ